MQELLQAVQSAPFAAQKPGPTDIMADTTLEFVIESDEKLGEEDKAWMKTFFANMGHQTVSDLVDVTGLQPIQAYIHEHVKEYGSAMNAPGGKSIAALGRIVKLINEAVELATPQISERPGANNNNAEASRLLLTGMLAEQGDTTALNKMLASRKVNLRELIDKAGYGEPSPSNLPSDDDLKKIGAAAELGCAMPPHICGFPDSRNAGQYLYPDMVMAFLRFGHGAMLQWRHDTATLFNMLTQTTAIAADRSHGSPEAAAKLACAYFAIGREQMFDWSRTNPEIPAEHDRFIQQVGRKFMERDETAYTKAQGIAGNRSPAKLKPASEEASLRPQMHCLFNAKGNCQNTRCRFSHTCAFCAGARQGCPNTSGKWMDYHLSQMKEEMKIVPVQRSGARDWPQSYNQGYRGSSSAQYGRKRSRSRNQHRKDTRREAKSPERHRHHKGDTTDEDDAAESRKPG
jgi:hypothetical protein